MRAVDIIIKKRDKLELTGDEIRYFVNGYTSGEITDYQAAAWAMAVLLNGMNDRETTDLTMAMAESGEILDLSDVTPMVVDKHSTGGVGDKTTLSVLPIVAACGLPCGKMSGRGLGFSGGTLDKLESIPGYRVNLSTAEFKDQLRRIGIVLTGQSADLAPADGKFYALRDVTGTVQSIPLIAASIMSKKIAGGANCIVLDVKVGHGAFMKNQDEARQLARAMRGIGELAGRKPRAVLSNMDQPLGFAVGNALELVEAIEILRGGGPADFREHVLRSVEEMLTISGAAPSNAAARQAALNVISNGSALEKLLQLVAAQGGDPDVIVHPERLPRASLIESVKAAQSGYISQINARVIGEAAVALGGGRARKSDQIDHAVGFIIPRKVGDKVEKGDVLFEVHANDPAKLAQARREGLSAFAFSPSPVDPLPLFFED